jgi:hypothetical protein
MLESSFSPPVFIELKQPVEPVENTQTLNETSLTLIPVHLLLEPHLQHLLTAAAVNLVRADAWLSERPRTKTRTSRFAALATAQAC